MEIRMPPGFEAVEVLGKGAMGRVYKAWQPKLQRHVAVKTCTIAESLEKGQDPGRLEDEALTIARLSHPNIVSLFDVFRDDEAIYLIMELLDGAPLSRIINPTTERQELGPLEDVLDHEASEILPNKPPLVSNRWLCEIGIAVGRALEYAHSRGVLHRDVKPANIVITNDHHVKLLDFSIARDADKTMGRTATGMVFGTVSYMSPEQILSQKLDGRTDVYALGCTLFHAATGSIPYDGDSDITICMNHVNAQIPDPRLLSPMLKDGIGRVILRCMAKRPEDRFESPGVVAAMLANVLRGDTVSISVDDIFRGPLMPGQQLETGTAKQRTPSTTVDLSAPPLAGESSDGTPREKADPAPGTEAPAKGRRTTKSGVQTLEGLARFSDPAPQTTAVPDTGSLHWADRSEDFYIDALPSVRESIESTDRTRKPKAGGMQLPKAAVIGGGALAVLLLIAGAVALFGGGDSSDGETSAQALLPTPTPTPRVERTPVPTPEATQVAIARTPLPTPAPTPRPTPMELPAIVPPSPDIRRFRVPVAGGVDLFVRELPPGEFLMGSALDEYGRDEDEGPRTTVRFRYPFYLGETEVTLAQWHAVMGGAPNPGEENLPAADITWEEARLFCEKLSALTNVRFQLPTEAQWEYACRAATTTPFSYGPILTSEIANIDGREPYLRAAASEFLGKSAAVGSYPPNFWGLCDMHGNVAEWVRDSYVPRLAGRSAIDPFADAGEGALRILRGGGFDQPAAAARCAARQPASPQTKGPGMGFRVVAEL
ncbi:MAG: eukaryotic-like serine/threonine-protein kinase [Candidatus Sumerlaeota bacterium]|nr:eukaryotic-like serine/threonine-protein kinase [Candidatus Sumerlaeota bacterium]